MVRVNRPAALRHVDEGAGVLVHRPGAPGLAPHGGAEGAVEGLGEDADEVGGG